MVRWFDYEPYEVTEWFELECDECLVVSDLEVSVSVWRDGSMYGSWECPECGESNYSDDLGNVSDRVDVDVMEVN